MLYSQLDDAFQITIPEAAIQALQVRPGKDVLTWEVRGGEVIVRRTPRAAEEEADPRPEAEG